MAKIKQIKCLYMQKGNVHLRTACVNSQPLDMVGLTQLGMWDGTDPQATHHSGYLAYVSLALFFKTNNGNMINA